MIDLINIYVIPSICIAYICYIWIETNAFYDYFSNLKIFKKVPIIKEYERNEHKMDFSLFLQQKQSFFCKLFSCHICLTFWISLLIGLAMCSNPLVLAYLSLILYKFL